MMKSFAIDISDQSVKYGELFPTSKGLRMGYFAKEKIPPGVVVSGLIQDQAKLAKILTEIRMKQNLNFVRVSLPEEQMYLFTLSLPKVKEKEIKEIILLQIEEHIPLNATDTIFEYEIISTTDKSINVLVSAIAKKTIEDYLSVFNMAGLTVVSFELEAQAIARAVISTNDKDNVMIVDFGDTRTGVSIVHDGKVFFTTTLDMGGVSLTNMIAKNFSLSFEEAEEMKRSYGLNGISNIDDIFPVILNGISVLRDELNKQYEYWKGHDSYGVKNHEIDRIILCGGDSNLTGLSNYLEASMKIKVINANVWVNITQMKTSVPKMSFDESLSYVTVLGLALGEFSYDYKPVVNVLPEENINILAHEYWKRFSILLISFFALIMLVFTLLLIPSYYFTVSKQQIAESELDQFNATNVQISGQDINNTINSINKNLALLSSVKPNISVYNDVLGILLTKKVQGITLSQILFSQRKDKAYIIEVHGNATDRISMKNFKAFIDNNERVTSSDLPISNYLEKVDLNFTMTIIIK